MKVLVTGATGFIGNYVILELLKRNIEVIATSYNPTKASKFSWFSSVNYVQHDIHSSNNFSVQKFHNPDAIIHLAWHGLPNYKNLDHIENEMMAQYFFIKKIITSGVENVNITGTCFEYGMQEGELSETLISHPNNPYALAKEYLRGLISSLQSENTYSLKWLRLFYMYGKGQSEKSILSQLQNSINEGKNTFNMSLGDQIRDYLPVETVAEYIVACSLQTKINGIINISSNQPITIKNLVENYLFKTKQTISLNLGFYPYPDYEPFAFWGNNSKLLSIIQ